MRVTQLAGSPLAKPGNLYSIDWFKDLGNNQFETLYGALKTLKYDAGNDQFRLVETDGTVFLFNGVNHATRPMLFKARILPGGGTLQVHDEQGADILEVRQSVGSDVESFYYDFLEDGEFAGYVERVTLRRSTDDGSTWTDIRKVEYTYYGDSTSGNFGDLESTKEIIYANEVGQTMLRVLRSVENEEWCTFTRMDDDGRILLEATPAAVAGYDEELPDLMGYDPQTERFEHLKDNEGLITLREYYTTTGSGAAQGHPQSRKIKQGQQGTEITIREWEYTSHTANGDTIFPVSKETLFPDQSDPGVRIETAYAYTFHSGGNQIHVKTTTLPVIATSQNGSGAANSLADVFDEYGHLVWRKDERGFITNFGYNIPTGAMQQQIDDVDTAQAGGVPAGWTTPAGGGLNLVTDYEHDAVGRITQITGPVHQVDRGGTATDVRRMTWNVYHDVENRTATGQGILVTSNAQEFLVNPVRIRVADWYGNVTDEIEAARSILAGKLLPTDDFPQTSFVRWTTHQFTECCKQASTRIYHAIPSTGEGAPGTNYDQTEFGYDLRDRRNRVRTPGGTITLTTFDPRGLPLAVQVGTNDATGGNMVLVTENQYDDGLPGGNGNLTLQTRYVDATTTRTAASAYDFRSRRLTTTGEIDFFEELTYDNLDRITASRRRDTNSSGNLIALREMSYDSLGRVFRSVTYGVDPATGTLAAGLTDETWHDPAGNVIKAQPAGSRLFTKTAYDSLARPATVSLGFADAGETYAQASVVGSNNTILEQSETSYDDASNVIAGAARQRCHNATGSGPLQGPAGTQPQARVTYQAFWPDGVGRRQASADYGTNGGAALTRPATIPTSTDSRLVTEAGYDDAGKVALTVDAAGTQTLLEYDDAGRRIKLIENLNGASGSPGGCPESADVDRITTAAYNADGNVAAFSAWNAETGTQTTTYTYGTTLAESGVATSTLLRQVAYPDSSGGGDVVRHTYNRLFEPATLTDQRGCVRTLEYDRLGRRVHDKATTLGTGVDGGVRRISTTWDVRGLPHTLTSWDNPGPGSGGVVNQVQWTYNDFGRPTRVQQSHAGAVGSGTPDVQYAYADGTANTIRPESLTYPDGRALTYNYGAGNGLDDAAGRVQAIIDDDACGGRTP